MKKLYLFFTLVILNFAAFCMPAFESFIPDTSGEFVYYRDSSFSRESYVGILSYDNSTFEIRYYAPTVKEDAQLLPEKDLALLISVNPDAGHWEMTGERILGTILPESNDLEIVNYMHDLLYEFSSRRSKTNMITPENQEEESIFTDFVQFGGNVKINYDCIVPLFNIRSIVNEKGEKVLNCVTTGILKDSADTTFSDFKGIRIAEGQPLKSYKKSKSVNAVFENQQLTIDENWTKQFENIWTLNDDSFITLSNIPEIFKDEELTKAYLIRKFLLSVQKSYTDFANCEVSEKNGTIKIISHSFQPETNKTIYNVKIITKKKAAKAGFDYFSIATYLNAYKANQSYYEKLIKSYKSQN